ncbi:MAG: GMC family oxidoreductase N-terminal domain-containing protein [Pseudomonadota bacterium]
MSDVFDYIIVGAGSAGCVLANRLSADPRNRVLLLEAGGPEKPLQLRMPAGLISAIFDARFNWNYPTVPDASRNDLDYTWSGGKGLGGSSSINGMLFIRGAAADYDGWAQQGCTGWDYASVLPFFKKIEAFEGGSDAFRSGKGPMSVSFPAATPPVVDAFVGAAQACGHPYNDDYNASELHGVALAQANIRNGRRHCAATAYLEPAKTRNNLKIIANATVKKLVVEERRIVGVDYTRDDQPLQSRCRGEVILSAGAIGSPKLLMTTGIGPADELRKHGIAVQLDQPSVGRNLMEHPGIYVTAKIKTPSFNRAAKPYNAPFVFANWLLRGRGPAANGTAAAQVMSHSRAGLAAPDLQMLLSLVTFTMPEGAKRPQLGKEDGISIACCLMQPESRGRVKLDALDPFARPVVDHELLGSEMDIRRLTTAARQATDILSHDALSGHVTAVETPVAPDADDEDWFEYLRLAAFRGDHPSGTCRMGGDTESVTDPELRVRGIDGLRVVDASVIPMIPRANTNAPVMMIAEKAADMILHQHAAH